MLKILKFPHPILLKKCEPVIHFNESTASLLDHMWECMIFNNGIGLSANQVGVSLNIFVMNSTLHGRLNIINPIILQKSVNTIVFQEGCLSAPGVFFNLNRSNEIVLQFNDKDGSPRVEIFYGIDAVCIQHEIEHLEGKSFFYSLN